MHISGMDISQTPPFTELVKFDFDWRVNLFIGPNASGKSALLREIDSSLNSRERPTSSQMWNQRSTYVLKGVSRQGYQGRISSHEGNVLFTSEDWPVSAGTFEKPGAPPIVSIGPVRAGLPELHDEQAPIEDDTDVGEVLSRPFSGSNFKIVNETMHRMADAMFEQQRKEDAPTNLERGAHHIFEVSETVYSCVRSICTEVLSETYPRNYVTGLVLEELDYQPLASFDDVNINRSLGINTIDQPNFVNVRPEDRPTYAQDMGKAPLYAGFLSSGIQTTFLWINWLAYRMLHYYDFADGWKDKPAILLIDEIENHLHPTWQRRVIPALLGHFRGLQIFATTHSPFVVAGLRAGQVHLLERNADGVVTANTNERDIVGWTTDEILRTFMGVDEPTDELTIQRSRRLRELRGKESLAEKERVELEELRQQVNEDLLSSRSPLELQRERYGDMMIRFIQSRESELSQDGG